MSISYVIAIVVLGMLFTLYRLIKGPTVMDRLVGVDTLNMMIVGMIGLLSIVFKNGLYLDIAIVYGVLAFLETVIISRYMEGRKS